MAASTTADLALSEGRVTRLGYRGAGAACIATGILLLAVGALSDLPQVIIAAGPLAVLYLWMGLGALRLGTGTPEIHVRPDGLTVAYPGLLKALLALERQCIASALIDPRPRSERQLAAATRGGGVVHPDFLEPSQPLVCASPAAHGRFSSACPPNVVMKFAAPLDAPATSPAARFWIRIGQGRNGQYCGPRAGHPMPGLRLVVADVDVTALERVFSDWNVLIPADRDHRYLAPIRPRDRARFRRHQLITVVVIAATLALFAVAALL